MSHPPCISGPVPRLRRVSRGFTILEVLVAIMILSIGVLGALGMQVNAIRMNREIRLQATALTMARELAERMRGNHIIAINPSTTANPYLLSTTLAPGTTVSAPGANCFTGQCTSAQMASWDIYEWQLRMRDTLPSPRIVVCMDSDPFDSSGNAKWACNNTGNVAMLKVAWNRLTTTGETEFTSVTATTPMLVLPLTAGSSE
jgi:type IV pilus assembly protein PilV